MIENYLSQNSIIDAFIDQKGRNNQSKSKELINQSNYESLFDMFRNHTKRNTKTKNTQEKSYYYSNNKIFAFFLFN